MSAGGWLRAGIVCFAHPHRYPLRVPEFRLGICWRREANRPPCCPIVAPAGGVCPAMHGSSLYTEHDPASAFMKFRGTKIASCSRAAQKQSQGPGMSAIGSVLQATPYCVQRGATGQRGRCGRKSGKTAEYHPAHEVSLTCPGTLLAALRYGPRRGKKRDGASGYVL